MIYSASNIWAEYKFHDSFHYVKQQALFTVAGLILMNFISKIDYKIYYKKANIILGICFLLLILVLFLINLVLFNHKMINVHTDFGREVFFAKLVSQNAVLYKDMFNTFLCPFSYLFNGLILKFLPVHLNTFYFAGAINALVILYGSYFVARKFLSRTISTVLTVFIMYYCCFYAGLMNFLMPYSYAVVYGLSACIISILLFLNYLNENKKSYLYASFFFAGAGASTKYEYILYAVMLAVFFAFLKKKA